MTYTAEEKALIWLCGCTDLDPRQRVALLRAAHESPEDLFENFEKFFAEVIKSGGNRVYKERKDRVRELEALLAHMEKRGQFAVTCITSDYPDELKHADPPLVLFGAGNRELLKKRKFCIVGSRNTPSWAFAQGKKIAEQLSEKFVIVTGLAEGGDTAAIRGALQSGNLISVLPCGLDCCYPAAHHSMKEEIREKGLLLSECRLDERTHKGSFHPRNRILAGLSEGVLVLSAGERSGTLITANYAVDFGRDVFAFPYSLGVVNGEGCNKLIRSGAFLCSEAEDIFLTYRITPKRKAQIALSEEESRVLAILREGENVHTAYLSERAQMPVYEIAAVLTALEIKGLAVKAGGNRYSPVN